MPDFTASTGLRDIIATYLDGCYYWATLHDATGGFVAGDVYAAGIRGELPTANGYTRGSKTVDLSNTNGVLDAVDVSWATAAGETLTAHYAALWMATANNIAGAKLLSVKDSSASPQTASNGGTLTAQLVNPITINTPA